MGCFKAHSKAKVAASTSAPLWAVVPTPELSVCLVPAKETIVTVAKLSASPVMEIKAVNNLSLLFIAVLPEQLGGRGSSDLP